MNARKPLIRGWDGSLAEDEYAHLDEVSDVASALAEAVAKLLHVEEDERERIAATAADWAAAELGRAGGLIDADEFKRRCGCRP